MEQVNRLLIEFTVMSCEDMHTVSCKWWLQHRSACPAVTFCLVQIDGGIRNHDIAKSGKNIYRMLRRHCLIIVEITTFLETPVFCMKINWINYSKQCVYVLEHFVLVTLFYKNIVVLFVLTFKRSYVGHLRINTIQRSGFINSSSHCSGLWDFAWKAWWHTIPVYLCCF